MKIFFNEKELAVLPGCTLATLLTERGVSGGRLLIEYNDQLLDSTVDPLQLTLQEGDRVSIFSLVAGG